MDVMQHKAEEYRRRISLAMNYISHHLDRELRLDEIAKAASFSPFHFHRIFKAVVGETVSEFTWRLRLEMAANRLLTRRRQPITEIACDCGFSSSQNLAKAFRQRFGMSPSEFRNSKLGNLYGNREAAASLAALHHLPDQNLRSDMKAEIKDLADFNVAFVRKLGPYGKEVCEQAVGELMQWAGPKGFAVGGTVLFVYWDNPEVTPPENCRTDACITVPPATPHDRQIGMQKIPGGPHAVCHFETGPDGFKKAWDDAFAWFVAGGYECEDRPCFERYYGSGPNPDGHWVFDVCIPLKRK